MLQLRKFATKWSTAATSSCSRIIFSQLFQKFVQSPQTPTFILKFLSMFFCAITFETYKYSLKIRSSWLKPICL